MRALRALLHPDAQVITPGARWSLAVLAVLMVALAGACLLFTVHEIAATEHKFCQVVTAATATPVQRPASPAANPSREQAWEWYERYVQLGRSLGC